MTDTRDKKWLRFGGDPDAIARWKCLIEWWEDEVGLTLGEIPNEIPNDWIVPPRPVEIIFPDHIGNWPDTQPSPIHFAVWPGQNQKITEAVEVALLRQALNNPLSISLRSNDEIAKLRNRHDKLVELLKKTLDDPYCYSAEAVKAARLLANHPNPYPKGNRQGDKFIQQSEVNTRREMRWCLDSIRTEDEKPLSDKVKTVLLLLIWPYAGISNGRWWSDDPRWGWTVQPNGKPHRRNFFKSWGFQKLNEEIRKDKSELARKGYLPVL